MDSFSQDFEPKMETFAGYDESIVSAVNHCDIVHSNNQAPTQEIQNEEKMDTLQQKQTEQTEVESNESKPNVPSVRLPALLDGEYFAVTRVENTNVTVRCQQCMKQLNGNLKSTGNFLSHVKRLHPNLMSKIRCKSSQRKSTVYVTSTLPDSCPEPLLDKTTILQNKRRKTEERQSDENEDSYEPSVDWNDTSLNRESEESESTDPSLRLSHNNSFMMEDEYDAVGRNVAAKLRNMRLDQRIITEKLLNDILFEAQLCNLRKNSSINI